GAERAVASVVKMRGRRRVILCLRGLLVLGVLEMSGGVGDDAMMVDRGRYWRGTCGWALECENGCPAPLEPSAVAYNLIEGRLIPVSKRQVGQRRGGQKM
ncbi:hypothetical protein BC826DRAFT_1068211, partial [Russula brevipes]